MKAQPRQRDQRDAADDGTKRGEVVDDRQRVLGLADGRHAEERGRRAAHPQQSDAERPDARGDVHCVIAGGEEGVGARHEQHAGEREDGEQDLDPGEGRAEEEVAGEAGY